MIPDLDMLERRVAAMRDLPWPIPAVVLLAMTDEDLDHLEAAPGSDRYWPTLNRVVARIEEAGGTLVASPPIEWNLYLPRSSPGAPRIVTRSEK